MNNKNPNSFWRWLAALFFMALFAQMPLWAQGVEARISSLLETADGHLERGRAQQALDALVQAATLADLPDPTDLRARGTSKGSPDLFGRILISRARAYEALESFAEARNDYLAFVALKPSSEEAQTARTQIQHIDKQAIRYLTNISRQNENRLAHFYNREESRFTIGVLPFLNQTQEADLGRVGFGISGFLTTVFASLGRLTDVPFSTVERSRLNTILTEVNIGRFYGGDRRIPPPSVGKILGAEFIISGLVKTENGRLMVQPIVTHVPKDTSYVLPARSASENNTGLRSLQEELTFAIADQIQRITRFKYTNGRMAFADAVGTIVADDLQRFLMFSQGFDMAEAGTSDPAGQILSDANIGITGRDRNAVEQTRVVVLQSYTNVSDILNQTAGFGGFAGGGGGALAATGSNKKVIKAINFGYAATQLGLLSLGAAGITDGDAGIGSNVNETGDATNKPPGTLNPANQAFIRVQVIAPLPKSN
ncbi:MAG: hypothetical protein JNN12_08390 [Bacteroidetes Order II. Incertae sedis bacterium]|nr:hypothetical protein [Bacteroidetes Order II. bacterium]